jgi:hypothetical protein
MQVIHNDTPPPLISRYDAYCSSSYDDDSSDDDEASEDEETAAQPLQIKRWVDFSSNDASASEIGNAQAPTSRKRHPPCRKIARKKSPRVKTCNAFLETANLSRDLLPLHKKENENQYFTPTKLTIYHSCDEHELSIVIDSGASLAVTPILKDFVGFIKPSNLTSLQGISARTNVKGEGTVCWIIRDPLGQVHQLRTKAYYVPGAKIRLFSPQ